MGVSISRPPRCESESATLTPLRQTSESGPELVLNIRSMSSRIVSWIHDSVASPSGSGWDQWWPTVTNPEVTGFLTERLPVEFGVEVELNELDRAICCELANHGEPGKKSSGHHQDSVVVTLCDQPRQVIELDCEAIDDPNQLEHLEIVRRRFAVRSPLGSQLAVEVLEEPRRRTNDASRELTSGWEPTRSVRCAARGDGAPARGTRQGPGPDR
jgi:hypothetical protein